MDRSEISDENCDTSKCKLKMGASQAFVLKCQKRRTGLNHFGFEYLKKLFNSVNGKKILDKCERKMIEVYPQVAKGERKTIITSPPHFLYTTKIKEDFVVFEEGVNKDTATPDDPSKHEATLEQIKKFRKDFLPQAGERDIFNPVLGAFFHHPGIFINGFEPNLYLKEFFKAARDRRNWEIGNRATKLVKDVWMTYIGNALPSTRRKYVDKEAHLRLPNVG